MTALLIHILHPPLREAVAEQIAAAKFEHAEYFSSLPSLLTRLENKLSGILVLDQAACAALGDHVFDQSDLKNIILGTVPENLSSALNIAEVFPLPLRLGQLMARLRYHAEVAPLLRDKILSFGAYKLNVQQRLLRHRSETEAQKLTEKETALLQFLAEHGAAARQDILTAVWGYGETIDTRTLETHIYQLRRKFGAEGEKILIFENGAYHLVAPEK